MLLPKYANTLSLGIIPFISVAIVVATQAPLAHAQASEWTELTGPSRDEVLQDIYKRYRNPPSLGIELTFTERESPRPSRSHSVIVLDSHRYYRAFSGEHALQGSSTSPHGTYDASWSESPAQEENWNGEHQRIYNPAAGSGSVRPSPKSLDTTTAPVFAILARDLSGTPWTERYDRRKDNNKEFLVYSRKSSGGRLIRVCERSRDVPDGLSNVQVVFEFDSSLDYAVTRHAYEYVDTGEIIAESTYTNHRLTRGVYVPFSIHREAHFKERGLHPSQTITVRDVEVDAPRHEEMLSNFSFPDGTVVYDYILNEPIYIGLSERSLDEALQHEIDRVQKATKPQSVQEGTAGSTQQSLRAETREAEGRSNNTSGPSLTRWLAGVVVACAGLFGLSLVVKAKKRGKAVCVMACCCFVQAYSVSASPTEPGYASQLYDIQIPKNSMLGKDLSRLCGVNSLYMAYLWHTPEPVHNYSDITTKIDWSDGTTIQELISCSKQIGLEASAKYVNIDYLLHAKSSSFIVLVAPSEPSHEPHYINLFPMPGNTSTYGVDFPKDRGSITKDKMHEFFSRDGRDINRIPVIEYASHKDHYTPVGKELSFAPSQIELKRTKPWALGEKEVQFESYLVNNTSQHVDIESIKKSCACTAVEAGARHLAPGEKTKVTGRISISPGDKTEVKIIASTKSGTQAILTVDASSERPFVSFQDNLSFGYVGATDEKELYYDVFVDESYPVSLERVWIDSDSSQNYELSASIASVSSEPLVLQGHDASYYKYTIACKIETTSCTSLKAVENLVIEFAGKDGAVQEHEVPLRFHVLEESAGRSHDLKNDLTQEALDRQRPGS